jgi:hypothetical protein
MNKDKGGWDAGLWTFGPLWYQNKEKKEPVACDDLMLTDTGGNMTRWRVWAFLLLVLVFGLQSSQCLAGDSRIHPKDLEYLGAFRLPDGSNGTDWTYSGNALTYVSGGDPNGPDDGFPGSLFGTGNDTQLFVSEISIPKPIISRNKDPEELNTAKTLQPFSNVFGKVLNYLEQPRVGLCFLPGRGGTVHFALGLHLQDTGFDPSHGWFETDLSNPQHAGPWVFGGYSGYVTNDYMCEIPKAWADANTPGQVIATGRGREGPWAGGGPALFAYAPPKGEKPPKRGEKLNALTPLLLYGEQQPGIPEIAAGKDQRMPEYSESDRFRGCAWLSAGERGAVIFTCTKALGESWYGFSNGVRWDYQCGQQGRPPCPAVPEFPYSNRGFWAEDFQARLIFYDPRDLAAVARGKKKTWEPKPYAVMDLSPYFFDPKYTKEDLVNYKRDFVGAACFDSGRGHVFIMEPLAGEDARSVVHVFRVRP